MGVRVTDWRCPTPGCESYFPLAQAVDVVSGWIERKCPKCGQTAHIGEARTGPGSWLKCDPVGTHQHTLAEVSENWRGRVVMRCRQCKRNTVIPDPT